MGAVYRGVGTGREMNGGEGNVVPQGPPGGRHGYQKPTQGESCVRRRCWEGNWPLIEGWSQPDAATAPHGVGAPG